MRAAPESWSKYTTHDFNRDWFIKIVSTSFSGRIELHSGINIGREVEDNARVRSLPQTGQSATVQGLPRPHQAPHGPGHNLFQSASA